MNGSHLVKISRRRGTKYTFTIKRNITIVRGDSGTGKTTLFDMVADYMRTGEQSGVSLQCDCPCVALTDYDWRNQLSSVHDSIVFVDEGLKEIHSGEFAHHVLYSSNYFVLISRADFPNLPYSVDEIYKIKTSGKYHSFVPVYQHRGNHRYAISRSAPKQDFSILLCEDSKSGFQFFERHFADSELTCASAMTNSAILGWLDQHFDDRVFVVADGAAFGCYADRVLKLQDIHRDTVTVCLPESFEWLLLSSGVISGLDVKAVLETPEAFVNSEKFKSWEDFFYKYLRDKTGNSVFRNDKDCIPEAFCRGSNSAKVMALIACRNVR